MKNNYKIGVVKIDVIEKLQLNIEKDAAIFIGSSNIEHIKNKHLEDYKKYGSKIKEIIEKPTYIAKHPKNNSIEYIKEYKSGKDYVLLAVRVSSKNVCFARTLFVMSEKNKKKFIQKGYLKKM